MKLFNRIGKARGLILEVKVMFWDTFAGVYDLFENAYNGKVNREFTTRVASYINSGDQVLECACGTGMISSKVAPKCERLIATDFSQNMLKKASKKCRKYSNASFEFGNIMELNFEDESFDKVIAGNVIHLLDEPYKAIGELLRVCKVGGKVIIPTYVTGEGKAKGSKLIKLFKKIGGNFKVEFNSESYKEFFKKGGIEVSEFNMVEGRMGCYIAVIEKK